MDAVSSAIDGSHTHHSLLVYLKTQERAVQIFLDRLCRPEIITYPLIFRVFFQYIFIFDFFQFLLLGLHHAVQVN